VLGEWVQVRVVAPIALPGSKAMMWPFCASEMPWLRAFSPCGPTFGWPALASLTWTPLMGSGRRLRQLRHVLTLTPMSGLLGIRRFFVRVGFGRRDETAA